MRRILRASARGGWPSLTAGFGRPAGDLLPDQDELDGERCDQGESRDMVQESEQGWQGHGAAFAARGRIMLRSTAIPMAI